MDKVANRDIPGYVRCRQDFQNSNATVFTKRHEHGYAVYSYRFDWPLAYWDYDAQQWFTHDDRYSNTTSKHHNYVRRGMGSYITLSSVDELITLTDHGYKGAVARKLTQPLNHRS